MDKIIEISHLSKSYGDIKAVNDLSFSVYHGELFAFLGVNGAGKSTTISIMCGQIKKDSGKIVICGKDTEKNFNSVSSDIGVVFQNSVLDKALSVKDNLRSRAALYGITGKEFKNRLDELSELLGFEDILNRTVGKLSGGQRRRIDIARALLHNPKILILDVNWCNKIAFMVGYNNASQNSWAYRLSHNTLHGRVGGLRLCSDT